MASLLNRPLIIHEQNSIAGLANKVLARLADQVLIAFPNVFPKSVKTLLIGNPIRKEMTNVPEPSKRFINRSGPLKILVVGGSLGARALNQMMPEVIKSLPQVSRPHVTHQAGVKHFDSLREAYRQAGVEAELLPFIDNMADRYAECDLLICRAGALTIAEIAAIGVASVLIPYPYAVDDHQTYNAHFLSDAGAAELISESELTVGRMVQLLVGFTREKLQRMAEAARKLGQPEATAKVAQVCMELAR
jgi:UDP-N-acetylglucosamine--N-acetylmuramyl-(pentapeptide) pyrophosphoryl-undecaprenol N-acetylglucosamine transferase